MTTLISEAETLVREVVTAREIRNERCRLWQEAEDRALTCRQQLSSADDELRDAVRRLMQFTGEEQR